METGPHLRAMLPCELSTRCIRAVYTPHVECRPCPSVTHSWGSWSPGPHHGYDVKRAYDQRFDHDRPLRYGHVGSTMSRLLKNGLVEVAGIEAGNGPGRKRYAITEAGITDMERWLATPEKPEPYL